MFSRVSSAVVRRYSAAKIGPVWKARTSAAFSRSAIRSAVSSRRNMAGVIRERQHVQLAAPRARPRLRYHGQQHQHGQQRM